MNLPVDIPKLIQEMTDIDSARKTPLAVTVLVDETAPGDLVGHVRSAFASAGAHTRVVIDYIGDDGYAARGDDDMAVIVAGADEAVGKIAEDFRLAGVPVMVASTFPSQTKAIASDAGHPIPDGDLVAPDQTAPSMLGNMIGAITGKGSRGGEAPVEQDNNGVIPLDEAMAASLDRRMGEWIIAACRDKKLAFALAFPFVRRPLSLDAVRATSLQNAGVGAVMFIPGADMPIMTLNQAKMMLQIAAAYGQSLTVERVKELAAVVGGAYLCRNVARSLSGAVPVLGWAIKGAVGFAGTEAMGHAAIEYFEGGGDIVGVAKVVQKARDEAVEVSAKAVSTPVGQKVVGKAKSATIQAARNLRQATKGGN